jgi:hypothetical protein
MVKEQLMSSFHNSSIDRPYYIVPNAASVIGRITVISLPSGQNMSLLGRFRVTEWMDKLICIKLSRLLNHNFRG